MMSRMLLNHIYDQSGSLKSASHHWSHRQSSKWTCERCARGHVPHRPGGGATTKTRIVFREILSDNDLVFRIPYNLTNHGTQPSHLVQSNRALRL